MFKTHPIAIVCLATVGVCTMSLEASAAQDPPPGQPASGDQDDFLGRLREEALFSYRPL